MRILVCQIKIKKKDNGLMHITEYASKEFLSRFLGKQSVNKLNCVIIEGEDNLMQNINYRAIFCDICGKRIPLFAVNKCIDCCSESDNEKRGTEYPECGQCEEAKKKADILESRVYVYTMNNDPRIEYNNIMQMKQLWGICEDCFRGTFDVTSVEPE